MDNYKQKNYGEDKILRQLLTKKKNGKLLEVPLT